MRLQIVGAALSLIIAMASGVAYLAADDSAPSTDRILAVKSAFLREQLPVLTADLGKFQIDPDAVLPQSFDFDYSEIAKFFEAVERCGFEELALKDKRLRKAVERKTLRVGQRR